MKTITIVVKFDDGDKITTQFNGTLQDAKSYYVGKRFTKHDESFHYGKSVTMFAYRVSYWSNSIKAENRNSRNLSDGSQFTTMSIAEQFAKIVKLKGGEINNIQEIESPTFWYYSIADYAALASMSSSEIESKQAYWRGQRE